MSEIKVTRVHPPYPFEAYEREVQRLSEAEGGGYLVTMPELPGCMSDGETETEAMTNVKDAFLSWVSARCAMGKRIPEPKRGPDHDTQRGGSAAA